MAFKSYYDWSEHWYVSEQDRSMDSVRRRRSSLFEIEPQQRCQKTDSIISSFACEPLGPSALEEFRQQRKVFYENTYQLEPPTQFYPDQVEILIQNILKANLEGKQYNHVECNKMVKSVTEELKNKIKQFNLKRYKLICNVMIGQNKDQGIKIGSRFLWDNKRDNFASGSFVNQHLFATAVVFAIYYE